MLLMLFGHRSVALCCAVSDRERGFPKLALPAHWNSRDIFFQHSS